MKFILFLTRRGRFPGSFLALLLFGSVVARAQVTIISDNFDPLSSSANIGEWTNGDTTFGSAAVVSGVGVGGTAGVRIINVAASGGTKGYSTCTAQYQDGTLSGNTNLVASNYNLSFAVSGAGGKLQVEIQVWSGTYYGGSEVADIISPAAIIPTSTYSNYTLNLGTFTGTDSGAGLSGATWQIEFEFEGSGATPYSNVLYIDNLVLTMATSNSVVATSNAPVTIAVDAQANRIPISPAIYGVAFAVSNQLSDLNFTLNRWGGNNETRYNWLTNCNNLDDDYYFESYDAGSSVPGAAVDAFVATSKNGGAQPMITIPMIGWAPKLGPNRGVLPSFSVAKYGPQTSVDPYDTDAGNGIGTNSVTHTTFNITNNPTDANYQVGVPFEQGLVLHLMTNWGASTNGGVKYYFMDNEHSLWFETHRDVHPIGTTMQEIWNDMLDYSSMVKSNDPNALVAGPEEWGWPGYFYSGYDQQWSGENNNYNTADYPDRTTNGGWDYIPWLLNQFYQQSLTNSNYRLLDYLTVHCYPQEGDVGSSTDVTTATALLRNQSTRVFWDTNYVDPSWINSIIMLIPRLKNWAATYYPGTKVGVTEYNWGAEGYINGATAQADILGIFGVQGLDLATRWTTPASDTPTYLAMKMYRNYDGNKSTFGSTSVSAIATNVDNVSAFAALRTNDGALTIMVVNKQLSTAAALSLNITNFLAAGTAKAWQLTSANVISNLGTFNLSGNTLTNLLPPESITLFVLPPGAAPPAPQLKLASGGAGNLKFWLIGTAGQRYLVQSSTNFITWSPVQTNTLVTTSNSFSFPTTGKESFYRAQWYP